MTLKWFLIEKIVNFGYLLKFIFDCLMAYASQFNFWLLRTQQGQLAMLTVIIIAVLIIERDDEKN